jgi:hypothetical protein
MAAAAFPHGDQIEPQNLHEIKLACHTPGRLEFESLAHCVAQLLLYDVWQDGPIALQK